jgi:hypothetical protein
MTKKEQKQKVSKKKDTKPKLKNWFGDDDDYLSITEEIRKKGTLKGRRL